MLNLYLWGPKSSILSSDVSWFPGDGRTYLARAGGICGYHLWKGFLCLKSESIFAGNELTKQGHLQHLDLFKVICYGFYHGIHHHFTTAFGSIFWELFRKHSLEQIQEYEFVSSCPVLYTSKLSGKVISNGASNARQLLYKQSCIFIVLLIVL